MEGIGRKVDERRIFSVEFKRQVVGQVVSGEKTLAELSRELEIQPAVLRNWMGLVERGGTAAVAAGEDVVPASRARELEQQVKDLQRLVGKQAMTIEILEATRDLVKKIHTCSEPSLWPGISVSHATRLSSASSVSDRKPGGWASKTRPPGRSLSK